MIKGFAIHNAPTNHGGIIPSTQVRSSQQGNLFVRAGDGHMCPKCKCWSTIIPSHNHIIFDGKPVAYAGDQLTCGAKVLPQQSHVVGENSATSNYAKNKTNEFKNSSLNSSKYGHRFQLKDEITNEPLTNICYEITKNNETIHGTTDENGFTQLVTSDQADDIQINIIYEEHTHEF